MQLKDKSKEVSEKLAKENCLALFSIPQISKVIVSTGIGKVRSDEGKTRIIENEMTKICGQKPKYDVAKKSISGFKLREGQKIGFSAILRGMKMLGFIEKLFNVVLPRIRDFRGIKNESFDQSNNLTIGIREQTVFPEIKSDEVKEIWGMSITINMKNASDRETVRKYLEGLGLIFEKE